MYKSIQVSDEDQMFDTFVYKFEWEIKNFNSLMTKKIQSEKIKVPYFPENYWQLSVEKLDYNSYSFGSLVDFPLSMISLKNYYSITVWIAKLSKYYVGLEEDVTVIYPGLNPISKQKDSYETTFKNDSYDMVLRNGSLKLKAKLVLKLKKSQIPCDVFDLYEASSSIVSSVRKMLNDKEFADFKFIVGEKEFNVHKAILAGASEVLKTLFTVDMAEKKSNECIINDINSEVFELLLEFIYTRQILNVGDHVIEVYKSAHYYQIDALKKFCRPKIENLLKPDISTERLLNLYQFATEYDFHDLTTKCWNMIKMDFHKMIEMTKPIQPSLVQDYQKAICSPPQQKE